MRALDEDLVQAVWQALCEYGPERSGTEARAFIARQPHLVALAERVMREFDREAQKAALGLLFLLAKVVEAHRERPLLSITGARVSQAYEATLAWLEHWDGADERFLERSGAFPQPHLIPYLMTTFYSPGGDTPEHFAEVKGSMFLLLKTAADAMDVPGADPDSETPETPEVS